MPVKFEIGSMIHELSFIGFFCFYLSQPSCSVEQNHFSYFSSESPKQHSCKVHLKLANGVRGVIIIFFLFLALAAIMIIGVEQFYLFS